MIYTGIYTKLPLTAVIHLPYHYVPVQCKKVYSYYYASLKHQYIQMRYIITCLITAGILLLQPTAYFDFEDRTTYILTFAVKDQYLTGLEKKDLTINVTNVNERPTIHLLQESISFDEDTVSIIDGIVISLRYGSAHGI